VVLQFGQPELFGGRAGLGVCGFLFEEERVFRFLDEPRDVFRVGFEGELDVVYFVWVVESEEGGFRQVEVLDQVCFFWVAEDEDVC
jgi:hypothetical protein